MDYLIQRYGIQKGDKVSRMKRGTGVPIIRHYAVYIGVNQYNQHTFAENNVDYGVRIVTSDEFFKDSTSIEVESISKTHQQRERAVQFAKQKVGQKYDLMNYNCEHFANEVTTGKSISKQIIGWGMGALLLVVGGIFFNKSKNNNG
jgi:uncharacterized protein YycO